MTMQKHGLKYDSEKPRLAEMILDFKEPLLELCKVWTFGANKYGKSNWKYLQNAKDRYLNALYRHSIKTVDTFYDDESNILHAAHMAFNALAYLYFTLKELKENEKEIEK